MGLDNPIHIIILLAVLLLVFGAKRLPEVGQSLGQGIRGFKDSLAGETGVSQVSAPAAEYEAVPVTSAAQHRVPPAPLA
jgi:sec-independent protein translocase protein TatA